MSAAESNDQLNQVRALAASIRDRLEQTPAEPNHAGGGRGADIGGQLRLLLTLSEGMDEPVRAARLKLLQAIGRTEASDQIRRGGACHIAGERTIALPADTNWPLLKQGLHDLISPETTGSAK